MDISAKHQEGFEGQRSKNEFCPDPFFSSFYTTANHTERIMLKTKSEENKRNILKTEENKS